MKIRGLALVLLLGTAVPALAQPVRLYEVKVTNITQAQTFTPILAVSHSERASLFEPGGVASPGLAALAEGGATGLLESELLGLGPRVVRATAASEGLLAPGQTATLELRAGGRQKLISLAAMLIPTNDTFVAAPGLPVPRRGEVTTTLLAYDAGTEANDQNCANIPGPRCGGAGESPAASTDEGFIHVSNGFHERGSDDGEGNEILGPGTYDWRNPVARVTIRRIGQ